MSGRQNMSSQSLQGFIIHPTYRLENGRPVVHLFGRLADGALYAAKRRGSNRIETTSGSPHPGTPAAA